MSTADRILAHLALADGTDYPPTGREIAEAIGAKHATVSSTLRRLAVTGEVRRVGEAFDGGWTWALAQDPP